MAQPSAQLRVLSIDAEASSSDSVGNLAIGSRGNSNRSRSVLDRMLAICIRGLGIRFPVSAKHEFRNDFPW